MTEQPTSTAKRNCDGQPRIGSGDFVRPRARKLSTCIAALAGLAWDCITREKFKAWGGAYIIENVMGAPLENPVMLCGSAFGLNVRRHRIFESNIFLTGTDCQHWKQPEPLDVSGTGARRLGARLDGKGGNSRPLFNFHKSWIGRMLPA
jgi:hypothetical protein